MTAYGVFEPSRSGGWMRTDAPNQPLPSPNADGSVGWNLPVPRRGREGMESALCSCGAVAPGRTSASARSIASRGSVRMSGTHFGICKPLQLGMGSPWQVMARRSASISSSVRANRRAMPAIAASLPLSGAISAALWYSCSASAQRFPRRGFHSSRGAQARCAAVSREPCRLP
jgi:hypothetical protein